MLCFMHPVKAEEGIAEAYFEHGVRTFSLDTMEELDKIVRATSTDGLIPWRGRPDSLKRGLVARIPPLDLLKD